MGRPGRENEVPPGKASDTDARAYHANFIARFSEYLCLLCSIQVDLAQFVAGFNEFIDTLYTVAREERKKKEIGNAEG